jgi:hypothetical protein
LSTPAVPVTFKLSLADGSPESTVTAVTAHAAAGWVIVVASSPAPAAIARLLAAAGVMLISVIRARAFTSAVSEVAEVPVTVIASGPLVPCTVRLSAAAPAPAFNVMASIPVN